jgi:hypothetical protein
MKLTYEKVLVVSAHQTQERRTAPTQKAMSILKNDTTRNCEVQHICFYVYGNTTVYSPPLPIHWNSYNYKWSM